MCCCPTAREFGLPDKPSEAEIATRQKFRKKLREGELDDKDIEIEVAAVQPHMEILAPPGMEELTTQIQSHVPEPRRRAPQAAQDEGRRGHEAAGRGGGGAAGQRRGPEDARAAQRRAERHRLPRRDRQDRQPLGNGRRGRLAPGRAARPAAAGRGHDRVDQVRHGEDRPHPVHRQRRLPLRQAFRPDSRAAGPLPDPRGARLAVGRRLRADPHQHRRLPHQAVRSAPGNRERARWSSPRTRSRVSPRPPGRSTSAPRTSARAACTR